MRRVALVAGLVFVVAFAIRAGHLIALPDGDGIVRRVPMLFEFDGGYYEALSLAVLDHGLRN